MADDRRPKVKVTIPDTINGMPEEISYDAETQELHIGAGVVAPVEESAWDYEVSGMRVVKRWFDRRKKHPDGRISSDLDELIDEEWSPSWTTELLELLNVLTLLVDLSMAQADLLAEIEQSSLVDQDELQGAGLIPSTVTLKAEKPPKTANLF